MDTTLFLGFSFFPFVVKSFLDTCAMRCMIMQSDE
jgi:hypothetical protein